MVLNRSAFKTYFDLADVSGNFLSLMGSGAAPSERSDDHESDAGSAKSSKKSINSSLGTFVVYSILSFITEEHHLVAT